MAKEENIILPVAAGIGLLLLFSGGDRTPVYSVPRPGSKLTPTQFLKLYWNEAKASQAATTIPALFTITQAGLESNWGNSAPRYNFFGIKDSAAWTGATQLLPTIEVLNGIPTHVLARFRAYPSARAGFIDHGRFFIDNKRYANALPYVNDPLIFAQKIAADGYATDPDYYNKIKTSMRLVVQLLQSNKLI